MDEEKIKIVNDIPAQGIAVPVDPKGSEKVNQTVQAVIESVNACQYKNDTKYVVGLIMHLLRYDGTTRYTLSSEERDRVRSIVFQYFFNASPAEVVQNILYNQET